MMAGNSVQPVAGGYVIDQTGLTTTNSDEMIDVNDGVWNRIKQIHDNSHLYAGGLVDGVFKCKQLLDTDKTKYADGTTLVLGANENVFMKLPQFWWKVTPDTNNADICEIDFTMDNPQDAAWYEWEGDTFIGVYKGVVIDSKLRSKAGELISSTIGEYTRTTRNDYRTYARNNGAGHSCLTYEVIHIMALLGFGWLRTLSARSKFEFGENAKFNTGVCDSLGMADGRVSNSSNFWGLEDYITGGLISEVTDNITRDSTNLMSILNTSDLSVKRQVQANPTLNGNRWITKIVLGNYADIFPKDSVTSRLGINAQYVCYVNIQNVAIYFLNSINSSNTGFIGIGGSSNDTSVMNMMTSRLIYKGNYQIIS